MVLYDCANTIACLDKSNNENNNQKQWKNNYKTTKKKNGLFEEEPTKPRFFFFVFHFFSFEILRMEEIYLFRVQGLPILHCDSQNLFRRP